MKEQFLLGTNSQISIQIFLENRPTNFPKPLCSKVDKILFRNVVTKYF